MSSKNKVAQTFRAVLLVSAAFLGLAATKAQAQMTYNLGVTSDYAYRGISQSQRAPALQGGADYAHESGLYVGAWASTVSWHRKLTGSGNQFELDLYGGYKKELPKWNGQAITVEIGAQQYLWPSSKVAGLPSTSTTEIYTGLTVGPISAKYSHSLTNLFGTADSKNSGYLDLTGNFDLGKGWGIVAHVGRQRVAHWSAASFTDYKLGVSKDIEGFVITGAVVGTNAKGFYDINGKKNDRARLILTAVKNF